MIKLLANRLGSIITAISVSTGAVAVEYDYQAYGARTETAALDQPYGFTGREHDAESGLMHYRARAYDRETGLFLQVDPIEFGSGGLNLTVYSAGNPLNRYDPSGLAFREFSDLTTSNGADSVATSTYVSVAFVSAAGRIAGLLSDLPFGDFGAEWHRGKQKFVGSGTGDCSPAQHAALQAIVNSLKEPSRCVGLPNWLLKNHHARLALSMRNLEKMQAFSRLAIARATISATCYRSGDGGTTML